MKNISKRLLSLAMVIAMVLSMMPTTVFAIEEFPVYVDGQGYASLEAAVEAANSGSVIKLMDDVTLSETVTLPAGVTLDGNGKTINGSVKAGGDLTFAGKTTITTLSLGWYNNTITIGKDASLEVTTGRVAVSYGNVFNIIGNIADAKTADKATVTPSLKLTGGISMNGDGGGVKFNITDAYVILGDSTSKNSGATGEFNINIDNSIVDFTKTLKTYQPTAAGLDPSFNITAKDSVVGFASHLELWNAKTNLTLDNTNLTVSGSFANAGAVNVENGSYFLVKDPIMSSHGGNTGTIVADGGVFELADSNEDWQNAGTMKVAGNGKLVTNDFKCVGEGQVVVDVANIPEGAVVIEANDDKDFVAGIVIENGTADVTLESGKIVVENVVSKTYAAEVNGEKFESFADAIAYANTITDGVANVTLLQDVTYGGGAINTNVVLDLNGKTITATGSYVFTLNPGTLTVKDSSTEKTGMIDGTETVGNVFIVYGGALTIESGKIHANNNVIFTYQSSSVITINGGELKSVIATGNILYLYEANTTTTVNGGTFYGPVACYAGTLKVAGGTFATDVSAYCAYGKTTKLVDGMYHIVDAEKNIYIGENSYLTLEDALNAAKDGDVIEIRAAGSYQLKRGALQEGAYYLPKNLTLKGTVDGVVVTNGPTIRCESIKLDNIDFINPSTSGTSSGLVFQISGNSQITNCTMDGYWGGSYYSLVNGSLLIDNCVIKGAVYGLNISENYDSDITITNTEISGWTSFAGDYNVVLDGCNLTYNGNYGYLGFHGDARIKNCSFGEGMEIGYMAEGITLYIDNSTAANGASVEGILEAGVGEKYDVYLDGVLLGDVELPEIQIIDIKGSLKDTDPDLTFALNFAIKNPDSLTEAYLEKLFAIYGGYYVDYVLTISGLNGGTVTFNANGDSDGYLAGQYDAWSANWLSVPFEDVVVKDGEGLYIMEYAAKLMNKQGLRFTLAEVAEIVQNFDCGVYFTPEFLAEHPDLKVSLQLKVFTEDAQGNKIENIDAATNNFENNYAAVVCGENKQSAYYATFAEAYAAAQAGDTIELLADVTLTGKLTINKTVTIDGNGHSIIANHTAFILETSADCTFKNITLDTNNKAKGVKIASGNVIFDTVTIPNSNKSDAITVNGSLTLKNYFKATTAYTLIDARSGVVNAEPGTVFDMTTWRANVSPANSDLKSAVDTEGNPFFEAYNSTTYIVDLNKQTSLSNVTLLDDVTLIKDFTASGTLNLNGHNLTMAEGKALKVSGSLAVIGDGDINGEVLLTNTTATVTTDKTLTATSGVEGYVVDYADGVYKLVVAANDVAENVQTGVTYTDLQEALSAAAKGETVKLLKDVEAEDIYISAGKTLDLNGYKLTITSTISASYSTTHIIDSTAAKGLLILAEGVESALNSQNAQLPVWTAEGVHFIDVTFGRALDFEDPTGAANADVAYFRFAFDENQVLLDQILANGSDGTGLTIRIKVNYTTASGMKAYQYFEYTNELVASYYQYTSGWQNAAFRLYLNGVESLADLSFTAEIVSVGPNGTSVIKSSVPL